MKIDRIIRINEVKKTVGLSASTIWRKEKKNEFPKRISLGAKCVGWSEEEIQHWIESRKGKNKNES